VILTLLSECDGETDMIDILDANQINLRLANDVIECLEKNELLKHVSQS